MSGLSKLKKTLKRSAAVLLTGVMAATCIDASVLSVVSAAPNVLSNEERGVLFANSRTDFRDESIYFVITTRFYDGDPSNNAKTSEDTKAKNPDSDPSWRGDFKGLIDKLDYIKALGFTAIWITPVVENDSGYDYHGYHAYDFSAVDNRYESNGVTYQTLIDAVHAKGMKVIQDVVLNHTCNWGEKNLLPITSDVYSQRNQVVMNGKGDPENIYHHNGFCGGGDWDNYEAQRKTIADDCFDLETENPKVYNYLIDCYTNYINMGVDAFRVDTVKHISRLTLNSTFMPAFKKAGGDNFYMFGEVCTKGHDVWYRDAPPISTAFYTWDNDASYKSKWSDTDTATNEALVDQHYGDHMNTSNQPTSSNAFLKGNDYHTPDYSEKSGMDVIDFQMHWSFMNANSAFNTALGEDKYFNDSTWNVVYVDSHDYGPDECQTQRYTGGTDAWAENLDLMFTFRGIPCIYYGSEIEFQKGMPIDVGPNAPLSQTGRAYFGDNIEGDVKTSDFTVFGNENGTVTGAVADTLNSTLSQHIMRLNRIRQSVPALRKGQYSTEGCNGNMAFKRRYTDSTTDSFALVAISGSATFTGIPNGTYVDAVTGDIKNVTNGTLSASVSGKGNMKVYVLSTSKTPAPGRIITNGNYLSDGGSAELIKPVVVTGGAVVEDTAISLNKTSATIAEGQSTTLSATVTPSDATYKSVTWTSSNPSVATVSGGKVTAVSVGTATITAKSHSGKTATCTIKVTENPNIVKPTGITLSKTSLTLSAGGSDSLTATVLPANATNKTVTWSTDNESVATVSDGTVTAVGEGTATITATTVNGKTATATVTVQGKTYPTISNGIYFEKPSTWGNSVNVYMFDKSTDSTVGAAWPGTPMKKDSATGVYTLEYSTTNSNLQLVFNDGSNQAPGQNQGGFDYKNLGLYTSSGFSKVVEPAPAQVEVTSVSLNKTSATLNVGDTTSLSATVNPSNATNKNITWTSSNTNVATVSGGVVTGVSAGTATITAKSNNGKTAAATITVKKDTPPVINLVNNSTLSATSITLGKTITAKGAATGGTGNYRYAYYYKKASSSAWTQVKGYSTTTSVAITPKAATTYDVCIKVKDTAGKEAKKYFTVKVSNTTLTNTSTLSATTLSLGNSITAKGSATGGSSGYKYAYYYKKASESSWTQVKGYSTTISVAITPKAATTYDVCVKVKDTAGKEAKKYFTVKVSNSSSETALSNTSTVSATNTTGSSVTVKLSARNGTAPYFYQIQRIKVGSSSWTTVQDYANISSKTVSLPSTGTYVIGITVQDMTGKTSTVYHSVTRS